jgi:hypothetical protein
MKNKPIGGPQDASTRCTHGFTGFCNVRGGKSMDGYDIFSGKVACYKNSTTSTSFEVPGKKGFVISAENNYPDIVRPSNFQY